MTYSLGGAMERNGVTVTVIDFVHFRGHYNPVAYLKTDEDAMKLAYALVFNTKKNPAASGGENEFWDKSAVMFLASLILYILYESPLYERNLNTMMDMILECGVQNRNHKVKGVVIVRDNAEDGAFLHAQLRQKHFIVGNHLGKRRRLQHMQIGYRRNISCDIILQNISQIKSKYKDDWETIIGNCDSLVYLGGNDYSTFEYISKLLGKQTIRTKGQSIGKGSHIQVF